MPKILTLVAAAILTLASVLPGAAAPKSAPKGAPGQMMQQRGSVPGHPGASGYAPGHLKRVAHVRSAREFAPGRHHVRRHHHWRYVHHRTPHRHHVYRRHHRVVVR